MMLVPLTYQTHRAKHRHVNTTLCINTRIMIIMLQNQIQLADAITKGVCTFNKEKLRHQHHRLNALEGPSVVLLLQKSTIALFAFTTFHYTQVWGTTHSQ